MNDDGFFNNTIDRVNTGRKELDKIDFMKYFKEYNFTILDALNQIQKDYCVEMTYLENHEFVEYIVNRYKDEIVTDDYCNLYFKNDKNRWDKYKETIDVKYKELDKVDMLHYLYIDDKIENVYGFLLKENPHLKVLRLTLSEFEKYASTKYNYHSKQEDL